MRKPCLYLARNHSELKARLWYPQRQCYFTYHGLPFSRHYRVLFAFSMFAFAFPQTTPRNTVKCISALTRRHGRAGTIFLAKDDTEEVT